MLDTEPGPTQAATPAGGRKSAHDAGLDGGACRQADAPSTERRGARTTDSVTANSSARIADNHKPIAARVPIAAGHDGLPVGYEVACAQGERPRHANQASVEFNSALDGEISNCRIRVAVTGSDNAVT